MYKEELLPENILDDDCQLEAWQEEDIEEFKLWRQQQIDEEN